MRTLEQIQSSIMDLCQELREHGEAAKAEGYQMLPLAVTRAILKGHDMHYAVGHVLEQKKADAAALAGLKAQAQAIGCVEEALEVKL
jgi:hypothetical protein